MNEKNTQWQQNALEKLLLENLKEQKRKRRWNIFFRLIYFVIIAFVIFALLPSSQFGGGNPYRSHTSLIKIDGAIMPNSDANATNVIAGLKKAFKDPLTKGIILSINSPGGAPVQAADIYNSIMHFRKAYPKIKIYAVCSDMCTSAAYYIASATNDIYANQSSLVGSIGVLVNGFGFVDTLKKLGIERRLLVSGKEKGFLDPFSPLKPEDVQYAQKILNIVHQQFIHDVKKGRGNRLKDTPTIFSGLAWTGIQGKDLGLIDGFGDVRFVASHIIKNTNIVDYTKKSNFLEQLSRGIGAEFYHQFSENFGLNGYSLQ